MFSLVNYCHIFESVLELTNTTIDKFDLQKSLSTRYYEDKIMQGNKIRRQKQQKTYL